MSLAKVNYSILSVYIALGACLAHGDALLRVRPHVVVRPESEVHLDQLMDVQEVSEDARRRLATIAISKAPSFGEKQELTGSALAGLLRPIVELEKNRSKKPVHVILPKTVVIDTVKRGITADSVGYELVQAWQPLCVDCRLEVEGVSLPVVDQIRDWTLKVRAELPRGPFSVPVEIIRENGSPLTAFVSGRLSIQRKVPVTKRLLGAGERIQQADIAWEYRDTSYSLDGIPSPEDLVGKRARQALRAGDILWRNQLEREVAIRRGELIQVRSGDSSWEIWLGVVAQQDAYIGDVISLKNPKTNTAFMGEVVGQGRVELR